MTPADVNTNDVNVSNAISHSSLCLRVSKVPLSSSPVDGQSSRDELSSETNYHDAADSTLVEPLEDNQNQLNDEKVAVTLPDVIVDEDIELQVCELRYAAFKYMLPFFHSLY